MISPEHGYQSKHLYFGDKNYLQLTQSPPVLQKRTSTAVLHASTSMIWWWWSSILQSGDDDDDDDRVAQLVAAWQPGWEKMEREWENEVEIEREWGNWEEMEKKWGNGERFTLYIFSFPPSLSISYTKNFLILSRNVEYGAFVANVTKLNMLAIRK